MKPLLVVSRMAVAFNLPPFGLRKTLAAWEAVGWLLHRGDGHPV